MADATTMIRSPKEPLKAFNQRLVEACKSGIVTEVALHVVAGCPVVTLFSEVWDADDEDVEDAREKGDKDLKVGDALPEHDPVIVEVVQIGISTDPEAGHEDVNKAQAWLDQKYGRADGGVVKLLHASGRVWGWQVPPTPEDKPTPKPTPVWTCQEITYLAVLYLAEREDEDKDEGADERMANTLRGKPDEGDEA